MKIKCLAVDDEPLALEIITDYISKVGYLELAGTFDNALDTINYLKEHPVDLIFLDIQMEGLTGIQLLKVLKNRPQVIFTTAFDSYALEGYELDALDYLLKPFSLERFIKATEKAFNKLKTEGPQQPIIQNITQQINPDDFLFVKTENRLQKVFFKDILFVEGQGDYLRINTPKERIMTLQKFSSLQALLPENLFVRVHKSYLVSLEKIENITRNRIKIGEHLIPISESYKKEFYEKLDPRKLG